MDENNSKQKLKVLVTGATGFVGSHLTKLLAEQGHQVYVLVRNEEKYHQFSVQGEVIKGTLSIHQDNEWIKNIPNDLTTVIHVAGLVHCYDVEEFYNINATATKRLVQNLSERFNNLHFILISSLAAFGPGLPSQKQINEQISPHPVSHYGISKLTAEKFLRKYSPSTWRTSIIRPPMVIGPHDPAMLELFKMVKGRIIIYEGKQGMQKEYSFVSVFDLIKSIVKVVEDRQDTDDYFSSHPLPITYKELVDEIKKQLNIQFTLNIRVPLLLLIPFAFGVKYIRRLLPLNLPLTPDKIAEIRQRSWICSSQKIQQKHNMRYKDSLTQILKKTTEDYRQRNWI